MTAGGLPHSDTLGSKPCRRLPQDYRGPTRPSSVLSAKHPPYAHHDNHNTAAMTKALLKNPRTTSDHGDAPHTARPHTITNEPKKKQFLGSESQYEHPTPPQRAPMLASTIQFSNHHPTRTPTPHQQAPGNRPGGHTGNHTPHQGPVAAREPNSTHHTTQSNTTLPRQQARAATTNHRTRQTPATKPCTKPCTPIFSVERR